MFFLRVLLSFALATCSGSAENQTHPFPMLLDHRPGRFVIAALFRVYLPLMNGACSHLNPTGVHNLEAFRYAVDQINKMQIPPWNGSLGYVAYDTCGPGSGSRPLTEIFSKLHLPYLCTGETAITNSVVGITGILTSQMSLAMSAEMAHCIPIISSLATTDRLTGMKSQYNDYFARTVAPDSYQAYALHKLISEMGWRRIAVVYGETTYAGGLQDHFLELVRVSDYDLCITLTLRTGYQDTPSQNQDHVAQVEEAIRDGAEAVVVLMGYYSARKFLVAVNQTAPSSLVRKTPILGSDGWTQSHYATHDLLPVLNGVMGIDLYNADNPSFDEHLRTQTIESAANPWLQKLIARENNCSLDHGVHGLNLCTGSERLRTIGRAQEQNLFAAIDLMARGIFGSCTDNCTKLNGASLMKAILNTSFNDSLAAFSFFNGTNGGYPKFSIFQVQPYNTSYAWVEVGLYQFINSKTQTLHLNHSAIRYVPGGKKDHKPHCGPESEPIWNKKECRFKCFKFFRVHSAFQLMFLTLSLIGFLAVVYLFIANALEDPYMGAVPYTGMLMNMAATLLFTVPTLHVFFETEWSCGSQKVIFAMGETLGALALALKSQGTKRFTRFSCEWCGLFTRNLKMATLLQILIVSAFQASIAIAWITLDLHPLHKFWLDGNDYIGCSLLQPFTTTYLYIIPVVLHSATFIYSCILFHSGELRWKEEGRLLIFVSAVFIVLCVGFFTGSGVSAFKETSFVGSGNVAVSVMSGMVFLMFQWFRSPLTKKSQKLSKSSMDTEDTFAEEEDESVKNDEMVEGHHSDEGCEIQLEDAASSVMASTSPSGYQTFKRPVETSKPAAPLNRHTATDQVETPIVSESQLASLAQLRSTNSPPVSAARPYTRDEAMTNCSEDSRDRAQPYEESDFGTVDDYVEKL